MPEGTAGAGGGGHRPGGALDRRGAPGLDGGAGDAGDMAAGGPTHWAYRPPVRPPVPGWWRCSTRSTPSCRSSAARAGLRPAPEAAREALIRRVTLDLTGLPPTLAEIDAFVADGGPGRLRAAGGSAAGVAPAFGERWAVPWLDAARYADSNGYEKDGARPMWKYRDWVVAALNADMPFDRFTLEQLAGDLLPEADAGRSGSPPGFTATPCSTRRRAWIPRRPAGNAWSTGSATTATVWLGSTLACAQCHDHKHDPFSQRDFYAAAGVLRGRPRSRRWRCRRRRRRRGWRRWTPEIARAADGCWTPGRRRWAQAQAALGGSGCASATGEVRAAGAADGPTGRGGAGAR